MGFLPSSVEEVKTLGWDHVDVVLVTGDAYVDHPSFGTAVIARVLENSGYKVAIIDNVNYLDPSSIGIFGKPRLFFGVTSGNIDSMLAKYTAFKKVRNDDPFSPGGVPRNRPDRAVIVYCNLIKQKFKDVPIVIGGIEASMRRFLHYDFWSDGLRRSILEDSRADILIYGMGEKAVLECARRFDSGLSLDGIGGTVVLTKELPHDSVLLSSEEESISNREIFLDFYRKMFKNQERILAQPAGKRFIVQYPALPMNTDELDKIYTLPFEKEPHPKYDGQKIPAYEMIKCSVNSHRGCVSGCSFCSLSLHQGRRIISRSKASILKETRKMISKKFFRGHVSDVGGPTANMYGGHCEKGFACKRESCLYPDRCRNLKLAQKKWFDLLREVKNLNGVKHVTIGSGLRYDLLMEEGDSDLAYFFENYISGQLKIAPEHTSPSVLRAMRKAPVCELDDFIKLFNRLKKKKKLFLLPYLMSNHPGCDLDEMKRMHSEILRLFKFIPEQVQSFIPLPMTISSVQYYTGKDPFTDEKLHVEKSDKMKRKQHDVFFK